MKIEYNAKSVHRSDQELLEDLRKTAQKLQKKTLTMAEYTEHGNSNVSVVSRRFGTWNKALALAGIGISNTFYSDQELFDNLSGIWAKLGKQPSRRDLGIVQSPISYKAYERRFGKWSDAIKAFVDYCNHSEQNDFEGSIVVTKKICEGRTSRDISLRLRFQVMQRDCFKCCACGASPAKDPSVVLHIDHIHPWSKGGKTEIDNLQTLCSKCNLGKSNNA